MTQQHLADFAGGAVTVVNPATKATRNAKNRIDALSFLINSHLLLGVPL